MENVFSIVNSKPSNLDFELDVDGLTPKNLQVRLCIKTNKYHISFDCKKKKGNEWKCDVPAIEHLEKGTYPFHVEVIADGYYFDAMKGTVNVTGTHQVYAKVPQKLEPEKKEEKPEPKKVKEVKYPSALSLANKILSETKETEKKSFSKDDAVRKILAESSSKEKAQPARGFQRGRVINF